MRILVVADPHGTIVKNIPKNLDLILINGDVGKADLARKRFFENQERKKQGLPELESDAKFERQVHKQIYDSTLKVLRYYSRFAPVYTLEGNVGISTRTSVRKEEEKHKVKLPITMDEIKKMKNVCVVKNTLRILHGLRIGFLEYFADVCWYKEFGVEISAKVKKETEKAKRVLKGFGRDLDILLCHQPPYGVLDRVNFPGAPKHWKGKHAGSKVILDYVKRYSPNYVFCGHIHEAKGYKRVGRTEVHNVGSNGDYFLLEL